jgi:biopolymer transport protein ExbD
MTRLASLVLACLLIAGCVSAPSQNVIQLDRNGNVTLNGAATSKEDLPAKLDKRAPLLIQAAPSTPYQATAEVMRIARQAGVRNVRISAEAVK